MGEKYLCKIQESDDVNGKIILKEKLDGYVIINAEFKLLMQLFG